MKKKLVIGSRKSKLAMVQSEWVRDELIKTHPETEIEIVGMVSRGDTEQSVPLPQIGGKGLFTAELESAIRDGSIDIAVHSLKDLPTDLDPFFTIAAIPPRVSPRDVMVAQVPGAFADLPHGAIIGSSSPRRELQLRALRGDIVVTDIRGNVDTRIKKVLHGEYNATILAEAGLIRLGLEAHISYRFTTAQMLSAPGQGALAVQCAAHKKEVCSIVAALDHLPSRLEVAIERAFLRTLEAGCSTPIGALARHDQKGTTVTFLARILEPGKGVVFEYESTREIGAVTQAEKWGEEVAKEALSQRIS